VGRSELNAETFLLPAATPPHPRFPNANTSHRAGAKGGCGRALGKLTALPHTPLLK